MLSHLTALKNFYAENKNNNKPKYNHLIFLFKKRKIFGN